MIDQKKCIGCGLCVAIDKEVFQLKGEREVAIVKDTAIFSKNTEVAMNACPVQCIQTK